MPEQILKIRDGDKKPVNLKTTISGGYIMPHNIIEDIKGDNINKVIDKLTDISSSLANQNLNFSSNANTLSSLIKKYPTDVTKKKYTSSGSTLANISPLINIEWDSASSGSFRVAEYDQDRKYLTIYNDSSRDLYISLDNDLNSKIIVDFDNLIDAKNLSIKYDIYSASSSPGQANIQKNLFNFSWDDYTNIYTYFTQSHVSPSDVKKYGYNLNFLTIQNASDTSGRLIINLTPDYTCEILNKYNVDNSGGLLTLSMSNGQQKVYSIAKTAIDNKNNYEVKLDYKNNVFTNLSDTQITYYSNDGYTNGFYISNTGSAPENYSYILNGQDSMTIYDTEAVLPYFAYFASSSVAGTNNLDVRITEAR